MTCFLEGLKAGGEGGEGEGEVERGGEGF